MEVGEAKDNEGFFPLKKKSLFVVKKTFVWRKSKVKRG